MAREDGAFGEHLMPVLSDVGEDGGTDCTSRHGSDGSEREADDESPRRPTRRRSAVRKLPPHGSGNLPLHFQTHLGSRLTSTNQGTSLSTRGTW